MSRSDCSEAKSEGLSWAWSSLNFREQNWKRKRIYLRLDYLNGNQANCREYYKSYQCTESYHKE